MNAVKEHCFVRGPLVLVLRLSRIHGVAPLRLESHGDAYLAQISAGLTMYSKFLLTALNILTIIGVILDSFYTGNEKGVKVHTMSALIVWLIDVAMIMAIVSLGIYKGPTRMKRMMRHLNRLERINQKLGGTTPKPTNPWSSAAIIGTLVSLYLIMAMDFVAYLMDAKTFGKDLTVLCIYGIHYLQYSMALLLQFQIAYIILSAQDALRLLNRRLTEFINNLDSKEAKHHLAEETNNDIAFRKNKPIMQLFKETYAAERIIQDFSDCYVVISNVVRDLDDEEGLMLLLMYSSFVTYLFVSSYYLIAAICTNGSNIRRIFNITLQLIWCIYHAITILLVVEPCHRVHDEMVETQVLVSQVIYQLTPVGDPMCTELDCFQKQLVLCKPTFSPLNICTLNRSQIAAVVAGVSTYLIIIVQQRLVDECK